MILKKRKTINGIINKSNHSHSIPDFFIDNNEIITDKQFIANRFNSFFTKIGPEIALNIEDNSSNKFSDFLIDKPDCTFNFQEVNENTVVKIIDKFPCKTSSGPDSISMKLVKHMKNLIALPISVIVNQMLLTGIFPDCLKLAKVKPIFKKDDKNSFTNYRPISLLPSISKIFEKVIYDQLYAYFQNNNLFSPNQYGFRSNHSTELTCLEIVDRIIQHLDDKKTPINIYLDLSKAFDTINHPILINKLNFYEINGKALDVFKSYLRNRAQFVEFDNCKSDILDISTGVPQGSVLGPHLYSLPNLINETSSNIIDKVYTHSVNGFRQHVKKCMIKKYSDTSHIINCYICNQN